MNKAKLKRQTFTISRELEYFSESELTAQTGYPKEYWWPGVVAKELIDNALDACEQTTKAPVKAPVIKVEFDWNSFKITDNGPGILGEVVRKIFDYSTRTSDKQAYVSPTRGALGNALKTIPGILYVLAGGKVGTIRIESHGVRHTIRVSPDNTARRILVDNRDDRIVKTRGSSICAALNSASSQAVDGDAGFLQKLVFDYSLFNPHATFSLRQKGQKRQSLGATVPKWRKWLLSDPTSAHWYNAERMENLVASYVSDEQDKGLPPRTVRKFVSEFKGFSGTATQKQVVHRAGFDRAYLRDLVDGHREFNRKAIDRLLRAMQESSAPVKPEALGVLGEDHFRQRIHDPKSGGKTFRYKRVKGTDGCGLPFVVECAFAETEDLLLRGEHIGLNCSVPLVNPIQQTEFRFDDYGEMSGLAALLARNRIDTSYDPVCFVLHLIYPRFDFWDRGKGSVSLSPELADAVSIAVLRVTKEWAAIKKAEEREQRRADRLQERYWYGRSTSVTIKDAAYAAIPEAYKKASGNEKYPANARQIMYAARPSIQEQTDRQLSDNYFTQTLLPDYVRDYPEETSDWDIVYDARGHLLEPHTGHEIDLGTLGVRQYLEQLDSVNVGIGRLHLNGNFPTYGPRNRFGAILYIEKEGFLPLLERARFQERYDLAIMSSKGMGTTAARTLIEKLYGKVKILVLHDFDKSGFSILGTLTRDTRRYEYEINVQVIDLGLRLKDVKRWKLQSERVAYRSDARENLKLNGATPREIEFLHGKQRRVELNAFTSDAFVAFLEEKLRKHGVRKIVPDSATIAQAYRRAAATSRLQEVIDHTQEKVIDYAEALKVPTNLRRKLIKELDKNPSQPWDEILKSFLSPKQIRG